MSSLTLRDSERNDAVVYFNERYADAIESSNDTTPEAIARLNRLKLSLRADPSVYLDDENHAYTVNVELRDDEVGGGIYPEDEGRVDNLQAYLRERDEAFPDGQPGRFVVGLRQYPGYLVLHIANPRMTEEQAAKALVTRYLHGDDVCGLQGIAEEPHAAFRAFFGDRAVEEHLQTARSAMLSRTDVATALAALDPTLSAKHWEYALAEFDRSHRPAATILESSLPDPMTAYPTHLIKTGAISDARDMTGQERVSAELVGSAMSNRMGWDPMLSQITTSAIEQARAELPESRTVVQSRLSERRYIEALSYNRNVLERSRSMVFDLIRDLRQRGEWYFPACTNPEVLKAHGYQPCANVPEHYQQTGGTLGYPKDFIGANVVTSPHVATNPKAHIIDVDRAAKFMALQLGTEAQGSRLELTALLHGTVHDPNPLELAVLHASERGFNATETFDKVAAVEASLRVDRQAAIRQQRAAESTLVL